MPQWCKECRSKVLDTQEDVARGTCWRCATMPHKGIYTSYQVEVVTVDGHQVWLKPYEFRVWACKDLDVMAGLAVAEVRLWGISEEHGGYMDLLASRKGNQK